MIILDQIVPQSEKPYNREISLFNHEMVLA